MNEPSLFEQAKNVLEWDRLLEALARHARSSMGVHRCRALPLASELRAARTRLQETAELLSLQETDDSFPAAAFPDVREPLARASKGAPMEAHELRDCSIVLGLVDEVVRFIGRHRNRAPALHELAKPLESFPQVGHIKREIDWAIEPDGSIRESASPELRRLTHHAHDLKQRMRQRLEQILHSKRYAEVLQETYFAQREGRYVVPVKAEMRGKIPGIVHDVSASGATVFLEPRELVELNNAIKVADLEVDREVRRILRELSAMVAEHADAMLGAMEVLAELDCVTAKAALSRQLRAQPVALNECGRIRLKQARHPLLALAKDRVVANDILLDGQVRVLVISGPNTGGKTVTLKMLGLFALMVRAGLLLPCAPDSEMAFFPEIYADIGDAQDLAKDLSSFSAHMTQMIRLLNHATTVTAMDGASQTPRALVLLDEPVTSTDPAEGAALAEALLVRLAQLGMKVVATTHYNALKALAQSRPDFANASVEFDVGTLSPTYRLLMGMPGGSSAFDIAGRLGMEESILEDARRFLKGDERALEDLLTHLQEHQRRLAVEADRASQARAEAERASQEAAEILARLRETERDERKGIKRKLTDELLRARAEVQAILDDLRRERTAQRAKEAKRRLAELEERERARPAAQSDPVPVEQLHAGDRVALLSIGTTGVLLESPLGKKRVRVKVGDGEVSVPVSGLAGLNPSSTEELARGKRARTTNPLGATAYPARDMPAALDVRGKAADEALDLLIAGLDRAALRGESLLKVIHGHGTGRLKAALREYLKESPYVASFRSGERAEGGDGVTIVELR
jgi:DNA mismatch repair protein MutS2